MAKPIIKRKKIIRAALELFVEKGIDGTTTRDIAEKAGAGEGTMYRYFESKEALAVSIFKDEIAGLMEQVIQKTAICKTVQEKLRCLIRFFYALFEQDQQLFHYLLLSEHSFARHLPVDMTGPVDFLIALIKEGQKKKVIRPMDPQIMAALLFGAVMRVPIFKIYGRIKKDICNASDEVFDSCWKMVKK
ncbi:MAG: TetR/AcrR family transcriptional regulator [Chlamydiota bacterium]|nr:TetR/AcrR family transcriptional regulator [Chlamydiota bacterium]